MTSPILFDIESTGLLRQGSRIHCIVARDCVHPEDYTVYDNRPDSTITMGVEALKRAPVLVGHNIASYDIPLIQEGYDFDYQGEVFDTLVLSRLFYPDIRDRDYERRPMGMPEKLYGSHGLAAWGYRLRCNKGEFGKQENAWDVYTPEMLDYCVQDTLVTVKLYDLMMRRIEDYAG
ncbi:MAG: hypothetical protein CL681_28650 [Blastopirellula sp.]|nr:hypothetical protein [Blastopirellula sp.]